MCAIFGIVGKSDPNLLRKISNSQIFRGPDSQDLHFNEDGLFCFGNNRLEVIDKEGGKQPMLSEDKNTLVIFNGAIYNFKEIKKYLSNKNISFFTNSILSVDGILFSDLLGPNPQRLTNGPIVISKAPFVFLLILLACSITVKRSSDSVCQSKDLE